MRKIKTRIIATMSQSRSSNTFHLLLLRLFYLILGLPFQHRMKWWNALPVYWKKSLASGKAKSVSGNEELDAEEVGRYAEIVEELSPEELEEMDVRNIVDELHKDEL